MIDMPEDVPAPIGDDDRPALLVIDVQGDLTRSRRDEARDFPMPDFNSYFRRIPALIAAARRRAVPLVYMQEVHHPSRLDFGRELDGFERVHCLEDNPATAIAPEVDRRPEDFWVRKRRYSSFFATDLEVLLRGLQTRTLWLVGGFTDVCVHYTFADAHQRGYRCAVVEDCVAGSSLAAHTAALEAMEYLQPGCRLTREALLRRLEAGAT
ncbi:MAG: isochorismatase family cysteine hydrolase [Steroidobacteraceae bacterium]